MLIDESSFILQGLRTALSTSSRVVVAGTARTEAEAFALLRACQPDVAVLDVRVGQASGVHICRAIREAHPNTAVLFFTATDDKYTLRSAILAGAKGYLLKGASGEAVVKSIEIVAAGRAIVDQRLTPQFLTWVRDGKPIAQCDRMGDCSKADLRVLALVAAGKSDKEIAQELDVRPNVVRTRLRAIYKRLNVSRRVEAVKQFIQWEKGRAGVETAS